jgi:hypothetical protein
MRRVAAAAFVGALSGACAACANGASLSGIGTSAGAGESGATSLGDAGMGAGGAGVSPIPSDFRSALSHVNGARFVSKGHAGGRWEAEVYASAGAVRALRGEIAVPVGARFVEEQFERGDAGSGPVFMMEKRPAGFDSKHGDWRYVAVGASGEVAGDGIIESCAGCHGDAPGDHLFRVNEATAR